MPKGYLTLKETARRLGRSAQTISRHIQQGTLTAMYVGRCTLIPETDIRKLEEQQRVIGNKRSADRRRLALLEHRLAVVESQLKVNSRMLFDRTIDPDVTDKDIGKILNRLDSERTLSNYSEERVLWWVSTLPFLDELAIERMEARHKDIWLAILQHLNRIVRFLQTSPRALNTEALLALLDEARRDFRSSAVAYLAMSGRNCRAADVAASSRRLLSTFKSRLAAGD